MITEFGRPIGEPIDSAGLKIKTPFIQKVHRFEKRILEWDAAPNQITTKDKRFIWLDTTARWRIKDALKFYQALGTETSAQSRLDDIIDSAARDLVTGQLLVEVVRDSNRIIELNIEELQAEEGGGSAEPLERIGVGRGKVARMILEKAQQSLPEKFGIELIDVRIKRINYVKEVQQKVFDRMIIRTAANCRRSTDRKVKEKLRILRVKNRRNWSAFSLKLISRQSRLEEPPMPTL